MSEVKINIEVDKPEDDVVSYTLREIPKAVHDEISSYRKEITYKRDKNYNVEQTYVEVLKEWYEARVATKQLTA